MELPAKIIFQEGLHRIEVSRVNNMASNNEMCLSCFDVPDSHNYLLINNFISLRILLLLNVYLEFSLYSNTNYN